MSYDAGALLFKLQTIGKQVFKQDMTEVDRDLERLGKTAQSTATQVSKTGDATDGTAKAARAAKAPLEEQAKATDKVAASSTKAAPAVKSLGDKVKATEGELRTVGVTMTGVGAAFAASTALSVNAARDWQTAWAGVTKTVDGTPKQLEDIENGLRGLAGELPSSHGEIAAVAEAAGQLGVKTDDVVAFTRTMIDLGETTNLSAEQAATSLAQFMNIMGTAGGDVDRLGATIVALGNDGASTEADIVSMAQRIAGSGKLVGATEGEVLALANALSSMGVTAELGGGVASRILQDLYSAVQTGGDTLDGFAKTAGMSAKDFATAFQNDPIRAMGAFATGLNGVEASGGNVIATLTALGFKSTEEQRVLLQLKSGGDLLTKSLDLQNTAWDENTALVDEAAKRYATVDSKMKIAGNSIVDAAIDFGSVFLPALEAGADIVKTVADGFGDLPEPVQGIIAVVAALAGVVGLSAGAFLLALPQIVAYRTALATLATAEMPLVSRAATVMTVATTRASRALGSMATFLKGPWGLAFIAAAAVVAGLNNEIQKGQPSAAGLENALMKASSGADLLREASKRGDVETFFWGDYADSLEDLSGLLDKVSNDSTLDFLNLTTNQRGALDSIGKLGDSIGELAGTDLPQAQQQFARLTDEYKLNADQQGKLLGAMPAYMEALEKEATKRDINLSGLSEEERLLVLVKLAKGDGEKASNSAAEAYLAEAEAVEGVYDELDKLLSKINEANGVNQDAISANADYQKALADITDTAEGFAATLDETTVAGSANADMLAGVAAKAQEAAEAQYEVDKTTMSAKEATDKYMATLETSRQAFIDAALAAGYNADEVQNLADKVFALPTEKEIELLVDTADAMSEVDRFLASVSGKTVRVATSWSGGITEADGGVVEYFANGGVRGEHHVAQIAAAGSYRVWAEPETGGEAYIPLAEEKRSRSTAILGDVAGKFGYDLVPRGAKSFADGGSVGAGISSSTHSPTTINYSPTIVAGAHHDEKRIARDAAEFVNERLRKAAP